MEKLLRVIKVSETESKSFEEIPKGSGNLFDLKGREAGRFVEGQYFPDKAHEPAQKKDKGA